MRLEKRSQNSPPSRARRVRRHWDRARPRRAARRPLPTNRFASRLSVMGRLETSAGWPSSRCGRMGRTAEPGWAHRRCWRAPLPIPLGRPMKWRPNRTMPRDKPTRRRSNQGPNVRSVAPVRAAVRRARRRSRRAEYRAVSTIRGRPQRAVRCGALIQHGVDAVQDRSQHDHQHHRFEPAHNRLLANETSLRTSSAMLGVRGTR